MLQHAKIRPINQNEYHKMVTAGILHEDDRVELLEGVIVQMSPLGSKHIGTLNQLTMYFAPRLTGNAIVSVQNPIQLGDLSEPEPDIAILKYKANGYYDATPNMDDVLLLIEIADSTVGYDRSDKIPLYAKYGIQEVWLIDLVKQNVEIYHTPCSEGYENKTTVKNESILTPLLIPNIEVPTTLFLYEVK